MKIKNFNGFLLEWGYGGEGGVSSKDPVKVKDRMFTEIDVDGYEDEEDEDKDIPILSDLELHIKESVYNEIDPYGEENWNEKPIEKEYKNWKGNLSDFIRQLKVDDVNELLDKMESAERRDGEEIIEDVLIYLEDEDDPPYFTRDQFKQIRDNIYDLLDELCEPLEDEGPDPDLAYDQWRDRNLD